MNDDELAKIVDDTVVEQTASHVFKSDFQGNRGRDCCMEMFGEEDDECRKYNTRFPDTPVAGGEAT